MNGQIDLLEYLDSIEPKEIKPKEPQNKPEYQVIKANDMIVIRERNFVEICTDSRILISATAKILSGNMVYWKEWFTYPFLDICKSDTEADERYNKHLENIERQLYQPPRFEVNVPVEIEDMYLCVNGIWSCERYTFHNGPLTLPHHN